MFFGDLSGRGGGFGFVGVQLLELVAVEGIDLFESFIAGAGGRLLGVFFDIHL